MLARDVESDMNKLSEATLQRHAQNAVYPPLTLGASVIPLVDMTVVQSGIDLGVLITERVHFLMWYMVRSEPGCIDCL